VPRIAAARVSEGTDENMNVAEMTLKREGHCRRNYFLITEIQEEIAGRGPGL
jgi:hypothetical protein